jgi:hypothetical protein
MEDPAKPKQSPSLEMVLSQQANDAIQAGADPHAATEMLGTMVRHLRSSPTLSKQGADAIAQGADPHAVARTVWELAQSTSKPPEKPGVLSRAGKIIGDFASHAVEHPIDTAEEMVTGPLKAAYTAVVAPSVGEARPDVRLSKGGNASGAPIDRSTYDAQHGAVTPAERTAAGTTALAAAAFPAVASTVSRPLAAIGAPRLLANTLGLGAGGAAAGAITNPNDPAAGAVAGGTTAAVLGATVPPVLKLASRGASSATTALALRPSGLTAEEMAADAAARSAPVGPQASATPTAQAINNPATATGGPQLGPTFGQKVRAATGAVVEKAGVESAKTRALREVARRFELDNVTEPDALAYAGRAGNKPVAVLDLGGGNVGGLARTAKDVPSLARRQIPEFLHARSAGSFGNEGAHVAARHGSDVEQRIGLAPENYYKSLDDDDRRAEGEVASRLRSRSATSRSTTRKSSHCSTFPSFASRTRRCARAERIRPNGEKIPALSATIAVLAADSPSATQNPQTLGTLDKMRQYVGDVARGSSRVARSIATRHARCWNDSMRRRSEWTNSTPSMQTARRNYGGRAKAMDAYEAGNRRVPEARPARDPTRSRRRLPESQADLYRRGGYDALRTERLNKMDDGANLAANGSRKIPTSGTGLRRSRNRRTTRSRFAAT